MLLGESFPGAAVREHPSVGDERGARVLEAGFARREKVRVQVGLGVGQGLAQRAAPFLIPIRVPARRAAAVGAPALHPVSAAPGGRLYQHRAPGRGGGREVCAGVGQAKAVAPRPALGQQIGQSHFPEAEVVAVSLPVRGQGQQPPGRAAVHAVPEVLAVFQQPVKGHGLGKHAVVEKNRHGRAGGQFHPVGPRHVEIAAGNRRELPVRPGDGLGLVGRKDDERDARVRERLEGSVVRRAFCQPHALGFAAEPFFKVGHGPGDLQFLVQRRSERHDDVVVYLGDGVAVPPALQGSRIRLQDTAVNRGFVALQPVQQRRPDVEAHPFVAVADLDYFAAVADTVRPADGAVAFRDDTLVPMPHGRGGRLDEDAAEPGIFAGRLIKMAVDAKLAGKGGHGNSSKKVGGNTYRAGRGARAPRGGKTLVLIYLYMAVPLPGKRINRMPGTYIYQKGAKTVPPLTEGFFFCT
ncbi:hypothetical protein KL86DPRO_50084 [uncultured delta proteobacterium]|uniref:Uncharacterized protein n=1 Tax=uncultured delta proteobacterium TaxID=34034 RepID=A0A212KBV3_9DELT|nr:hypothetical protein KL86DPRO_50084 [uncultured delta proteobacterium]